MVAKTRVGSAQEQEFHERHRQQELVNRERRTRVEILSLPHCRICGGATDGTTDPALTCVCVERQHALADRLARILERAG